MPAPSNYSIKENSLLARIAARKLKSSNIAFVLGKTIHLYNVSRQDFLMDKKWLKHELCHIDQFKQYGYFRFVLKYLWESIRHGYYKNKYEIEAREAENL